MKKPAWTQVGFWHSKALFIFLCILISVILSVLALLVCWTERSMLPRIPDWSPDGQSVNLGKIGIDRIFRAMTTLHMWAIPLGSLFVFALLKDLKRTDLVAAIFACLPAIGLFLCTIYFSVDARRWADQLKYSMVLDPLVGGGSSHSITDHALFQLGIVLTAHFSVLGCTYVASVAWGLLESKRQRHSGEAP